MNLNDIHPMLHNLAQIPAAFGNSFLVHREDDSQANLEWDEERNILWSRAVREVRVGIGYKTPAVIIENDQKIREVTIVGRNHDDILTDVVQQLPAFGLKAEKFSVQMNYQRDTDAIEVYKNVNPELLSEAARARSISHLALTEIRGNHAYASEIRVWPHHFDTGMLLSESEDFSSGFGLGFSIADQVCDIPYFYVYARGSKDFPWNKLPVLSGEGHWINADHWKGAIMPWIETETVDDVTAFFREVLESGVEKEE